VPDLDGYDLVALTSPNGVRIFFERLRATGRDARSLAGCRIAVVGPGTADAVRAHGIEPDVIPSRAVGEGLADALSHVQVKRALVARAQEAREVVPDALRGAGAQVDVLTLYRTTPAMLDEPTLNAVLAADWATFASGSAARNLVSAVGRDAIRAAGLRLASIGPVTSQALRDAGLEPDVEAAEHSPSGLVAALVQGVRG
jgi:uroporphyrinogen III methyltransferase/synthase